MLRLIVNKAKSHFNTALELAERDRNEEAIAELNNALDLDHSHVNSHVVLGTLYAKMGNLEKAKACWEEALALDPRLQKAREYLGKGEAASQAFPICRRQRRTIVFLVLILIGAVSILAVRSLPSPYEDLLVSAVDAYKKDNSFNAALQWLDQIPPSERDGKTGTIAQAMRVIIETEQDTLVKKGQEYVTNGNIQAADQVVGGLLKWHPSAPFRARTDAMRAEIKKMADKSVSQALEDYKERKILLAETQKVLVTYRGLSVKDNDILVTGEATLSSITQTLRIEDTLRSFQKRQIDEWTLLEKLAELHKEYPASKTLPELIRSFQEPLAKRWTKDLEAALEKGDADGAARDLQNLQRLYAKAGQEKAPDFTGYSARIQKLRTEDLEKRVRDAYERGEDEQTIQLGEEFLKSRQPQPETRKLVETLISKANERLAQKRWRWILERDRQYLDGVISVADAEATIQYYPQVAQHLPRAPYPTAPEHLLLYTALAYRQVGQPDKALGLLEKIEKEYPKSRVMRWVKVFKPKVGKPSARDQEKTL
jgi:tetratricopeptide (TPR) repeat protein